MVFFESKDKTNRIIYLTKERWLHLSKEHPEVSIYFRDFEDILSKPTKIVNYLYDKNVKYYYRYFKERNAKAKYLLIIVKYLNGKGFIITSYFVRKIQ